MMYSKDCVLCVLVNGVPQNELDNGTVNIPYGTEYVIRVRNKNKKLKAVARITVDGENVAENGVIIEPNSYVDLEGTVNTHRKFKVVSINSPEAVDFGKNGSNTNKTIGTIIASFYMEKERPAPPPPVVHIHHYPRPYPRPKRVTVPFWEYYQNGTYSKGLTSVSGNGIHSDNIAVNGTLSAHIGATGSGDSITVDDWSDDVRMSFCDTDWISVAACVPPTITGDVATVEGSYTSQQFGVAHVNIDESSPIVLRIFLQGYEQHKVNAYTMSTAQTVRPIPKVKNPTKKEMLEEIERLRKLIEAS